MTSQGRSRPAAIVAALVFALGAILWLALTSATAQHSDLDAILKRTNNFHAAGQYDAALAEAQKLEAVVKARFGTNHENYATALNTLANVYYSQGKYAQAEGLYQRSLAIGEKALGAKHPDLATTLNNLAVVYESQSRYAEAERFHRRALAIREKALGANHPDVAQTLNNLAIVYQSQGKYADAEGLYRRTLAIDEQALGANHPAMARTLGNLANVYREQAKYAGAEDLYRRALAIQEQALGAIHPEVARTRGNLANVYHEQGKYGEAEDLYQRALAIEEQALGANHPDVARTLGNLANLYREQGKYGEAEDLYRRAVAIREQALGANHPYVALSLNNLAVVYQSQGRYAEAEDLYRRALAIREQALGANHPDVAGSLSNLATVYGGQGKYGEAEKLCRRALAIEEKALGANHPKVAQSLNNLAVMYERQAKYAAAEGLHRRTLAIREQALGANHPDVAASLNNLAIVVQLQENYADAEGLYRRALAIREQAFGANHPEVAQTLNNLAILARMQGDGASALAYSRKATRAVIAHASMNAPGAGQSHGAGGLVGQLTGYFKEHVANLALAARMRIESGKDAGREAMEMAQWAVQSSAADAVAQMAARFATDAGPLAQLARERQDLAAAFRERDKALVAALSKPPAQQNRAMTEAIRKEIAEIEARLVAVGARLDKEFPEYAALARPKPLKIEEAQAVLGTDEALIFWLPGANEGYVFALTGEGFEWSALPIGEESAAEKVAAFRRGLEVDEVLESIRAGQLLPFDLAHAHALYAALLSPVEYLIKDKRHLLLVPSGPLTALPFHLLVTETPALAKPQVKDIAAYRDAAWLIKRHAVTVLPSVASLWSLRVFARKDNSAEPMIGFGDPVFGPGGPPASPQGRGAPAAAAAATMLPQVGSTTRAYSEFWRGREVDRERLAAALVPLPDTADELKAVAAKLGAPMSAIHLGRNASELAVKRAPLSNYRVVYFATHGLIAGELKGLGEPSLVLTLPVAPSETDDGLLTASEVAQLKLNADFVVLSACNTAAGDRPGAEALSGLARAFFYAGARALLVSHWKVASQAAVALTTSTFDILASYPGIGRAEALRRAMLDYMNGKSDGAKADPLSPLPGIWGPFAVVGEGAAD